VGVAAGISIYELKLKQAIGMIEKKIKTTLGREINVTGMLIQQALDKELKKISAFSSRQIIFMMVLKCDAVMKLIDIQKQFGIPDAEVDNFLGPLKQRNLITAVEDNKYIITEKGVETLGKLWAVVENTENRILEGFSEQEKKALGDLVRRLKINCTRIINSQQPPRESD
jgi:TrmH family RNA methyltransferase